MDFGLFYQLPCADDQSPAQRYQDTLEQIRHGDEMGFDCAWLAELHFYKPFSIMSSPLMVAAVAAQRTERIRLGIAVNLLPLWHPLRSAEDGATADLLSGGRLEFGVGRGAIPLHFAGFDASREESRGRFEESLEVLKKAWTRESFAHDGEYFHIPETSVVPKPLQQPHPPIRVAANSPETAVFAAEQGYSMFVASVTNPIPKMFEQVQRYRDAWKPSGEAGAPAAPDIATMFFVHPGDDLAQVRRTTEPSLKNYFQSVLGMTRPATEAPSGAESYRYMEAIHDNLRRLTFETMTETMGVFGSPQACVDRVAALHEELGMKQLICWFNPGGRIAHRDVLEAMSRFAKEVAPALRDL